MYNINEFHAPVVHIKLIDLGVYYYIMNTRWSSQLYSKGVPRCTQLMRWISHRFCSVQNRLSTLGYRRAS